MAWAATNGMYISGRAYLDEADKAAVAMEAKWGCGRLRLLVGAELREKFDRQRYLLDQAMWHGDLEQVRRESGRMVNAWTALDRAAEAAGCSKLDPQVIEVAVTDPKATDHDSGFVAAIVPDAGHAHLVKADGRKVVVYTLDEIARMLGEWRRIADAKVIFPGVMVTKVRRTIDDPLDSIHDSDGPLDDPIPF